jgi:hypothetical protein
MSETPRWGSGGLCSNRLDEFSMTGTADALNRPEFHRGSCHGDPVSSDGRST